MKRKDEFRLQHRPTRRIQTTLVVAFVVLVLLLLFLRLIVFVHHVHAHHPR